MGTHTPAPALGGSPEQVRDGYLTALLDSDLGAARSVLDGAIAAGMPVRRIYLDVLQPTLYEVGRRWSHADISVAQEHLATAATQSAMARLAERLSDGRRRVSPGAAVVACVSDELHAIGGRMVADFLEADGWRVAFLGQLTPGLDLAALAAEQGAQLVALSAASAARSSPGVSWPRKETRQPSASRTSATMRPPTACSSSLTQATTAAPGLTRRRPSERLSASRAITDCVAAVARCSCATLMSACDQRRPTS